MTSRSVPLCTIGIEIELSWSVLSLFDWTVKFVAKSLMGMVWEWLPMYLWNCLIGSLVI